MTDFHAPMRYFFKWWIALWSGVSVPALLYAAGTPSSTSESSHATSLRLPLDSYQDGHLTDLIEILSHRIDQHPFNLIATLLFACAICHTFLTGLFRRIAHRWKHESGDRTKNITQDDIGVWHDVHFGAQVMHFLGEVEVVFGLWVLPLLAVAFYFFSWADIVHYVNGTVNYTEPMFVVVIMALASSRPVVKLAENSLHLVARFGGYSPAAWWLSILTIAPLLGSFITEPAAMTISALLLAKQFYQCKPSPRFAYATIGLLFVNISVGGTLSHFAAPPVLMVAALWNWDLAFMFTHFGWKAALGIVLANTLYFLVFRREFATLKQAVPEQHSSEKNAKHSPVPAWITVAHLIFMAWTVFNVHYPVLFIGGFLFFLGFVQATHPHQSRVDLKPALLVGFFLAGLVTHGGLQGWWIAPVLGSLSEVPLMVGATVLTAFNDNAAVTYLSTLVPSLTDGLKYAVVAGAVTGGGLTVIANAPNPAGQSILAEYFDGGVSPLGLVAGAIIPTFIMGLCFMLIR